MAIDREPKISEMVQINDCYEAVTVIRRWRNGLFLLVFLSLLCLQAIFWAVDLRLLPADTTSTTGPGKTTLLLHHTDLAWPIRLCNLSALLGSTLYLFCIAATLCISIAGRLGGLKHITRALFISVLVVLLLIPWQQLAGKLLLGALFDLSELRQWVNLDPLPTCN
ncbi:MAG: hypothetical protein QHH07_02735, partial [Sedimentisphaerales bacterium]|nr:hypothetical protein [Sedimentisphaerales bacterium]